MTLMLLKTSTTTTTTHYYNNNNNYYYYLLLLLYVQGTIMRNRIKGKEGGPVPLVIIINLSC